MEITKDDLLREAVKYGASNRLISDFKKHVLSHFENVAEFLHCNESEIVKRTPRIGAKQESLMKHLRQVFCDKVCEELRKDRDDERIEKKKQELEEIYRKRFDSLNRVVTIHELEGVVEMMKLMVLEKIRLSTLMQFLDSVKVEEGADPLGGSGKTP